VIADEAHRSQYGFKAKVEQKTGDASPVHDGGEARGTFLYDRANASAFDAVKHSNASAAFCRAWHGNETGPRAHGFHNGAKRIRWSMARS
jgi:hypothetical protein